MDGNNNQHRSFVSVLPIAAQIERVNAEFGERAKEPLDSEVEWQMRDTFDAALQVDLIDSESYVILIDVLNEWETRPELARAITLFLCRTLRRQPKLRTLDTCPLD